MTSVHCDAAQFVFPPENLVVYFFNPFDSMITRRVLDNLRRAIGESGRRAIVVFRYPVLPEVFADPNQFKLLRTWRKYYVAEAQPLR